MARKRKRPPITIDAVPEVSPSENFERAREQVALPLGALPAAFANYGLAFVILIGFGLLAYFSNEADE